MADTGFKVLIGTSNVKRHYDPEVYSDYEPYKMVKCCNMEVFRVSMVQLSRENEYVILSILENILVDSIKITNSR